MFSLQSNVVLLSCLVARVLAHGQIYTVSAGGKTMDGPNIYFAGDSKNANTPVRVMYKASSPAFVLPSGFTDPNQMSCEGSANTPAPGSITVAAGGSLDIAWAGATGELMGQGGVTNRNPWVHAMGPVMDYITSCNGPCNKFNAKNAGWVKLAHAGINFGATISSSLRTAMTNKPEKYFPTSGSGLWAMAKLVQDGSKWTVNVPEGLAAGEYIIRHEIAAVHNPLNSDPTTGPQVYISCVQIKVTGNGSKTLPAGTQSSALYAPDSPFAKFNVYEDDIHSFTPPGPAIWDGVSDSSSSDSDSSSDSSSDTGSTSSQETTSTSSADNEAPSASASPSPKTCKARRKAKRDAEALAQPQAEALKLHRARRSTSF